MDIDWGLQDFDSSELGRVSESGVLIYLCYLDTLQNLSFPCQDTTAIFMSLGIHILQDCLIFIPSQPKM